MTGAGRGIGLAIATALAGAGARVTLMGRDRARLEAAAASVPGAAAIAADITDEAAVKAAFAARARALRSGRHPGEQRRPGGKRAVRKNRPRAVRAHDRGEPDRHVPLHPRGAARHDSRSAGRIVNVASTAGQIGYAYVSAYCAAKHGVVGLTRSLALETAKRGVTVNAVCPGYTETDIVRDAVANIMQKTGKSEAEARDALTARNPQGRMVQPAEVADAVLWLVSPGAASITGQAISVSGGEVM